MTNAPVAFSRIVIDLGSGAPDRETLRLAARFAGLLRIELLGLFAHDPQLAGLVDLPVLREFRTLEQRWLAVPGGDLARYLDLTAALARRALDAAGRSAGVRCHFERTHAAASEAITAVSSATDIIIAAETKAAPGHAPVSFGELVDAALATPAAVLIVPSQVVRARGPVLAIAEPGRDPDLLASAAAIAGAAKERLEVAAPSSLALPLPWGLSESIGEVLIVLPRTVDVGAAARALAAHRRVPVLVLPPKDAAKEGDSPQADRSAPAADQSNRGSG